MEFEVKHIENLCKKITDGSHFSPENDTEGVFPMYSVKDMEYNGFSLNGYKTIGKEVFEKLSKADCRPLQNDILIAKDGSYLKYVFKTKQDLDACILSSIAILRPNVNVIAPDYFVYILRTKSVKGAMANYVSGSALPRIILSDFKKMKVRIAKDQAVQHRIASILSAYDNLIENNNKRIRLLEQMAENLYKEWFVRFRFPGHEKAEFENGLPNGWRTETASNVVDVMSGGTPKTEREDFYGGDIPFYTPKDADDSIFVYSTITYITEEGLAHCNSQYYPVNTLMITARGTVGKLSLLAVPMAMNQSCFALKFKDNNHPYYLYYSIKNEVSKLKKMASGGVFDTIVVKTFDHIKITVPSEEMLFAFDKVVTPLLEQIQHLQRQSNLLSRQRDLLLPRLMSGKLEVKC